MRDFETEEQIITGSDAVNINWSGRALLTPTGVRVIEAYWRALSEFKISRPPERGNTEHYESQIHYMMHRFGPYFIDGSQEPPFKKVSLELGEGKGVATRVVDINDFMYAGLTEQGEERLKKFFPDPRAVRRVGTFANIQFHTMAHLFGEDAIPGGNGYYLKDNTFFVPKTEIARP